MSAGRSDDRDDEVASATHDSTSFEPSGTIRRPSAAPHDAASLGRVMEHVLDSLGTAVVVVNVAGYIAFANHRARALLGRSEDELLGVPVGDVLVPFASVRRSAEGGDGDEQRERGSLPDRPDVIVGYRASRLQLGDGQPLGGYTVSFQDITAFEKVRGERDRLARLAAVSDVLPSLIEEFRAPIDAIESVIALTVHEAHEEAMRFELEAVLIEVRRLGLALEGVGSIGRQLATDATAPIDDAIREVCTVLSRHAQSRAVTVFADVSVMPRLPFDATVVRAMVFHALTNAIASCDNGGRVFVVARVDGKSLRIRVQDDGCGMTPETLASCRQPFFSTRPSGTGMGLTLCDRAVAEVDGELRIESSPRRGTTVTMLLPIPELRRSGQAPRSPD